MKRTTFNSIIREAKIEANWLKHLEAEAQRSPEAMARRKAEAEAKQQKTLQHAQLIKDAYLKRGASEQEAQSRYEQYIKLNS